MVVVGGSDAGLITSSQVKKDSGVTDRWGRCGPRCGSCGDGESEVAGLLLYTSAMSGGISLPPEMERKAPGCQGKLLWLCLLISSSLICSAFHQLPPLSLRDHTGTRYWEKYRCAISSGSGASQVKTELVQRSNKREPEPVCVLGAGSWCGLGEAWMLVLDRHELES